MNFRSLRNPDLYHGRIGKNYFEGWYFKLVDANMEQAYAFIPGIFFSANPEYEHSFLQVVDGTRKTCRYLRFPAESFTAENNVFSLAVEGNSFGRGGIDFNLSAENAVVEGLVRFRNHRNWPESLINPGSMGFYNYIPRMQCYSQVCSMDFDLEGALKIDGSRVDFSGGRGYIEKNWGSAFPFSWIWIQCNHFEEERASLSCSIGHIPFLFSGFRGFLVGLYAGGDFYQFTTANRSKAEVTQKGSDVTLSLTNRRHSLMIECETKSEDFILLNGPRGDQMIPLVQENLQGLVNVELKETGSGKALFTGSGRCAGVEYGGKQMMILD